MTRMSGVLTTVVNKVRKIADRPLGFRRMRSRGGVGHLGCGDHLPGPRRPRRRTPQDQRDRTRCWICSIAGSVRKWSAANDSSHSDPTPALRCDRAAPRRWSPAPVGDRTRHQIWGAPLILDELDEPQRRNAKQGQEAQALRRSARHADRRIGAPSPAGRRHRWRVNMRAWRLSAGVPLDERVAAVDGANWLSWRRLAGSSGRASSRIAVVRGCGWRCRRFGSGCRAIPGRRRHPLVPPFRCRSGG